jgi:uracil-DNA glycosylase
MLIIGKFEARTRVVFVGGFPAENCLQELRVLVDSRGTTSAKILRADVSKSRGIASEAASPHY